MAWVMMLTSFMIFQDKALSEASMYFLKILLSLSGAVMLATLPGFFDISYGTGGLSIRAAGGAAAFVFIYTQSPHLPAFKPVVAPHGSTPSARPGPTSSVDSFNNGGLPFMVALSLSPYGFAPAASAVAVDTVAVDVAGPVAPPSGPPQVVVVVDNGGESSGPPTVGAGLPQPVLSALPLPTAVGAVAGQVYDVARAVIVRIVQKIRVAVDGLATGLRSAVSWVGEQARNLIESLSPAPMLSAAHIREVAAELPEQAGELLSSTLDAATSALSGLAAHFQDATLVSPGAAVKEAPQVVAGTLRSTTEAVPDLVTGTVGTVNHTVGGLTQTVTGTVNAVSETARGLTQSVTDTVTDATGHVLATTRHLADTATAGINSLTDSLNDTAPALIEKLDPELAARLAAADRLDDVAGRLGDGIDRLGDGVPGALRGATDVTGALPAFSQAGDRVRDGLRDSARLSNATAPAGGLTERFDRSEEVRGGCGSCVLPPIAATTVARTGGALDAATSRNGGRGLGSSRIGGAVASTDAAVLGSRASDGGGGASPVGGLPVDSGPARSSPIAGTVNAVGAGVGGTVKSLVGRRR